MKSYNDTTYAILGILTTGCRSGYAIKQLMDQSLNHFWKISYGQIYPTLKRIVKEELATVQTTTQAGRPDKKEYFLTDKGEKALLEWLKKPIEQLPSERNEVLLKLFFGRHQSIADGIKHVTAYKQKLATTYQIYTSIEQRLTAEEENHSDLDYWLYTLDYGKRTTKAAIEWCDVTMEQLRLKEE